jgi:alanyl-tRNA synthetase
MQSDINKMYEDVNKASALNKEFTMMVKEINYRASPTNLLKLRQHLDKIQAMYHDIMLEVHKQQSSNQKSNIKNLPKQISASQQVLYSVCDNGDNKIVNRALTELINEDQNHAFVLINKTNVKLQYIAIANKIFVQQHQFNANQVIQKINQLSQGSGGGHNQFAQGGTSHSDKLPLILEFIKSL